MFGKFDFSILDDPDFKEDAVREELVVPILNRLGYTATGEHRIIRTKPLVHPYVYIGTKQYKVNIIPDYLLVAAGETCWVMDAKAPNENIREGKNVEQAYSYAIHKDVRVQVYALCNGRELVIFHISKIEPLLIVDIKGIDSRWDEVNKLLSPLAFTNPALLNFLPDFGLTIIKLGGTVDQTFWFPLLDLHHFAKAADDLYSVTANFLLERPYCVTFDLDPAMYQRLLDVLDPEHRELIKLSLSRQPYQVAFRDNSPVATIGAELGTTVQTNKNESFLPLRVVKIMERSYTGETAVAGSPSVDMERPS